MINIFKLLFKLFFIFKLLFGIFIIILLAPQTPKHNIVLNTLYSKKIFATYGETKRFLNNFTWFCIIIFLVIAFSTSIK